MRRHLNQLVKDVLTWPHIESVPAFVNRDIIRVRLEEKVARSNCSMFMSDREFARFLLAAPTSIWPWLCHWRNTPSRADGPSLTTCKSSD